MGENDSKLSGSGAGRSEARPKVDKKNKTPSLTAAGIMFPVSTTVQVDYVIKSLGFVETLFTNGWRELYHPLVGNSTRNRIEFVSLFRVRQS